MLKVFANKGEANAIPINAANLNYNFNELINMLHPVGEFYETSDSSFNPNVSWGGTWELESDGTVLVSKSSTSGSKFNNSVGTVVGEENHTLTIEEMPSHDHHVLIGNAGDKYAASFVTNGDSLYYAPTNKVGGNQAHNNVQPSKICFRWHRIA